MTAGAEREVAWDAAQRAVLALPAETSGVVVGAPGTGKTEVLVERVRRLVAAGVGPDEVLVLTPTRQTATALRDRLALAVGGATSGPLARSVASFAFQLVRAAAVAVGQEPPQLLTGGDEDRIIADLLAGDDEDAAAGAGRWPGSLGPEVRASRAFRTEVRLLAAECAEHGIAPGELALLGEARGVVAWTAAASFLRDYRFVLDGMRAAHRDAATLLAEAGGLLRHPPRARALDDLLGRLRVVLVDDAQELTRGGVELLTALRARDIAVLALGDPDIGSGAFRGASPALFAELCDVLGEVRVLDGAHRSHPAVARLVRAVTASIGASGRVDHRRPPGDAVAPGAALRAVVAPSPFEEVDRIARTLREWHVLDGLPWRELAVIAHDTRQVAQLEVELAAREVPTAAAGVQRPLGTEQVVRDIVGFVRLGMAPPEERDPDELSALLLSPFGGLDAVGLRRLRARLRHAELAAEGTRPARELLQEAMAQPLELGLLDAPEARAAERVAVTLRHVHERAARGATVHELLWEVWDAARDASGRPLSRVWREVAATRDAFSAEIDHALDALVALFDAAKRFVERSPDDGPGPFIRRILDSDVPEDTLSAPARPDRVAILTPAAALGAEYEGVVIAGVQDGVWPNLRLRGGLLDTWRLAADVAAWRSGEPVAAPEVIDRRRAALHDELRLFARAASRARSRLLVSAVDDDDLGPSPLFAFLPDPDEQPLEAAEAEHPLTLRGLVSQHRRTLTTAAAPAVRRHSAEQLVVLARHAVPGAAPGEWFGIAQPSSAGPLRDPARRPVPVSPSKLKTYQECPLDWAIRALGGDTSSWSAGVGTILHAAMEEVPGGELAELAAVVESRWGELEFEAPWISRKERIWAETLTGRLHAYLRTFHEEGGRTIGAEARFRLAVDLDAPEGQLPAVRVVDPEADRAAGRLAVLSGAIDRVEVYANGRGEKVPRADRPDAERVLVVDLKTGRSEERVSDAKVVDDPQLAAYQLAFLEGLVPGARPEYNAGARLVVLSKTLQKEPNYRLARQEAMDADARAAFLAAIVTAARGMASPRFDAPIDAHCATSRFGVCAVHTVPAVSAS